MFPFAFGQGKAFSDNTNYLGAWIRVLPGPIAANANYAIAHGLKCLPRFALIIDAGTTVVSSNPMPRGTTAWSFSSIYVSVPAVAAGQSLTVLIA
jgi:hypothetical protein